MEHSNLFQILKEENRLRHKRLDFLDEIKPFDCGNSELNEFLFEESSIHQKHLGFVTYLLETESETIAYYSLANDLLKIMDKEDFKADIADLNIHSDYYEYFFEQDVYPTVKIGRFAVTKKYQCQGVGQFIIDSLIQSFKTNNKTGCQFITVDAINDPRVISFYERNKFILLTMQDCNKQSRQMHLPLLERIL